MLYIYMAKASSYFIIDGRNIYDPKEMSDLGFKYM